VPEASVRRRVRALSGFIGRKEFRKRPVKFLVKSSRSTGDMPKKLVGLSDVGDAGILHVGVKSIDMQKNTKGEGRHLGVYRR